MSAVLGILAACAGAALSTLGHDSGMLMAALALGSGLVSLSVLRRS